jgi:hypothetical protein
MSDFITAADAAKLLDISPTAVRSLCDRGHLPGSVREPWGPGVRWLIPKSAVLSRRRQKKAGKLPKGGNPNMVSGNDLWRLREKKRKKVAG